MSFSNLRNPASHPLRNAADAHPRDTSLPPCLAKPRTPSKNFLLDRNGFIHLTPPRRTVAYAAQECLPPRPECLFGGRDAENGLRSEQFHGRKESDQTMKFGSNPKIPAHPSSQPCSEQVNHGWSETSYQSVREAQYGPTRMHPCDLQEVYDSDVNRDHATFKCAICTDEADIRVQHLHDTMDRFSFISHESAIYPSAAHGVTTQHQAIHSSQLQAHYSIAHGTSESYYNRAKPGPSPLPPPSHRP